MSATYRRKLREFQQLNLARPDLPPPQSPRLQCLGWPAIPADSHIAPAPCADRMGGSGTAALGPALGQEPRAESGSLSVPIPRSVHRSPERSMLASVPPVLKRRLILAGCSEHLGNKKPARDE